MDREQLCEINGVVGEQLVLECDALRHYLEEWNILVFGPVDLTCVLTQINTDSMRVYIHVV